MRRIILSLIVLFTVAFVEQAANGKARCGKNYIR